MKISQTIHVTNVVGQVKYRKLILTEVLRSRALHSLCSIDVRWWCLKSLYMT